MKLNLDKKYIAIGIGFLVMLVVIIVSVVLIKGNKKDEPKQQQPVQEETTTVSAVKSGIYFNGENVLTWDELISKGYVRVNNGEIEYVDPLNNYSGCDFYIGEGVKGIKAYAMSISSAGSVYLPSTMSCVNENAFSGNTSIKSVSLPTSITKIASGAFSECKKLTKVTLTSSLKEIGENAFSKCSSLTSITIPDSVTTIGEGAFLDCSKLTRVTVPSALTAEQASKIFDISNKKLTVANSKGATLTLIVEEPTKEETTKSSNLGDSLPTVNSYSSGYSSSYSSSYVDSVVTPNTNVNTDKEVEEVEQEADAGPVITTYVVKHYQKIVGEDGYTLKSAEEFNGVVGSTIYPSEYAKDYTGFYFKEALVDDSIVDSAEVTDSFTVSLFYDRNYYSITLNAEEGVNSVTGSGDYEYGSVVSVDAELEAGYSFRHWYSDRTEREYSTQKSFDLYVSAYDTSYTAYADINTYSIIYSLDGGTLDVSNPDTYTPNKTIKLNNPTKNGYTFMGWTGSNGTTPQADLTIPKGSYGERTYVANWKLTDYSITYDLAGGIIDKSNPDSYTMETETFTLNNPTKDGYIFSGWVGSNGTTPSTSVSVQTGSIGDLNFKAVYSYEPDTTFTVNYYQKAVGTDTYDLVDTVKNVPGSSHEDIDISILAKDYKGFVFKKCKINNIVVDKININADGSTVVSMYYDRDMFSVVGNCEAGVDSVSGNGDYEYGSSVTLTATLAEGFDFNAWTGDIVSSQNPLVFNMPAKNINLTANSKLKDYSISYDLDGGVEVASNPVKYNAESASFTLSAPRKVGYNFIGWTGSNGNVPQTSVTISGSTGDLSYTANYEKADKIKYTVRKWQKKLNTYTDAADDYISADAPAEIELEIYDTFSIADYASDNGFTGFSYGYSRVNGSNDNESSIIVVPTVTDGNVVNGVIDIYYVRDTYSITVKRGTGISSYDGETMFSREYGDRFTVEIKDSNIADGYHFKGWTGTDSSANKLFTISLVGSKAMDYTLTAEAEQHTLVSDGLADKCQHCSGCDYVVTTHNFTEVTRKASCTLPGGTYKVCSVCNYEELVGSAVPATGHSYDSKGICTVCNHDKYTNFSVVADLFTVYTGIPITATLNIPDYFVYNKDNTSYRTTEIAASGFQNNTTITSVTLPDTLVKINNSAFYGCSNLASINIPVSVNLIDTSAFASSALTNVSITGCTDENGVKIGVSAFKDCSSLSSLALDDTVTSIGDEAFKNCRSLTSVTYKGTSYTSIATLTAALTGDGVSVGEYAFSSTGLTD